MTIISMEGTYAQSLDEKFMVISTTSLVVSLGTRLSIRSPTNVLRYIVVSEKITHLM